MQTLHDILHALEAELAFVSRGGYRAPIGWRPALVFEDSPTCRRGSSRVCPRDTCVLLGFVPRKSWSEAVPCRHIPLNESGETIESLYRTGSNEEIEQCLRRWLHLTITELKAEAASAAVHKKAA